MDDHTQEHLRRIQETRLRSEAGEAAQPAGPLAPRNGNDMVEQRILEAMAQGVFDEVTGNGKEARLPLTAQKVANLADQRIQAAMEEGLFENLPGAGKPIDLYDDLHVPPDMRLAYRMMKGQKLAPPWVELQKDLNYSKDQYRTWFNSTRLRWARLQPGDQDKALAELRRRVNDLNKIIHSLNAEVPSDQLRVGLMVYDRELRLLQEAGAPSA